MLQSHTLSLEEQERRRQSFQAALINTRLEGLEPDPIILDYAERYIQGEMTTTEMLAAYFQHVKTKQTK